MKIAKIILSAVLASVACAALAVPGDVQLTRRWLNGGPGVEPVFITEPTADSLWLYDRTNRTLAFKQLGTGFDCSGSTCNVIGGIGPAGAQGASGASAYDVAAANGFVGTQAAWLASLASTVPGPVGPAGATDYLLLINRPTLGTAATRNIPASGNAAGSDVVIATDTRLTDARTPLPHNSSLLTDMTSSGRSVAQAADASAIRSLIGAISSGDAAATYATQASVVGALSTKADASSLTTKFNTPSCPPTQYLRGDGSCATFPTIPAAQVQSDWSASSGLGVILNKPTIPVVPIVNRVRVTTAADGTYTWTLPAACSAGTTPVVSITPESVTAGDAVSHRITAVSNTSVSVFAGRSAGLSVLSLTVLGVPSGAAIPVHLIAICP